MEGPGCLLERFEKSHRLLIQALMSGSSGASLALRVFQRSSTPDRGGFHWGGLVSTLTREEPCLEGEAHSLAVKPLVCLFPVAFKRNLLAFLHRTYTTVPRDCLLDLVRSFEQDPKSDSWVQALLGVLNRDLESCNTAAPIQLTSECQQRVKLLSEKMRAGSELGTGRGPPGRWMGYFSAHSENYRKRKSETVGLTQGRASDSEDGGSQSKKQKVTHAGDTAAACGLEEKAAEEILDGPVLDEGGAGDCGLLGGLMASGENEKFQPSQASVSVVSEGQGTSKTGAVGELPDRIRSCVPKLRELLESDMEKSEPGSSEDLQLLNECDPAQVELLCRVLRLSEVPEQVLPQFCTVLLALSPDLSCSTAAELARSLFLNKVLSLTEPASRFLTTAVTSFCSRYPRPSCCALIGPVLQARFAGSVQMELVCRLIEDCLDPEHYVLVFEQVLSVPWSEEVLSVIHSLLDRKVALSQDQFEQFIDRLSQEAAHFSKSMKFAKMVLALLTKHQSSVTGTHKNTLACSLALNETFLKKCLQAALRRIAAV
ncbi:Fanconi anemia group E protein [Polyodon spathula]|uniref:Fanconi anemia group E protein n=1 Tax=Polyodon spathula TaxID=7913 RepID=UPI001B7EBD9B|nr:Fanconi anemia group E protein [Polyodon spathula]XP_041083803.1 Fanconi anemia group E protein [Polyodon spathula]